MHSSQNLFWDTSLEEIIGKYDMKTLHIPL